MTRLFLFFLFVILAGMLQYSCKKEEFVSNLQPELEFSHDTLSFDTIFTSIGSVTKRLTVRNPHKQPVYISKISLAGRDKTPFRLNINGRMANEDYNVTIPGGDSLFLFVEVTINPAGNNLPFLIMDSVVFNLNGNTQDVDLIAFGQDCHFLDGVTLNSQTWNNDKPYLIYNSILVDTLETLTIMEGCRIHFHKGSGMFIKGTLVANGTFDKPIFFSGDRLEDVYADVPGQWGAHKVLDGGGVYVYGGLHFLKGSIDNVINWAVIKNADKGIQVDSLGISSKPVLSITNSRIENMSLNCLDARTTRVRAANTVFANSGSITVALRYGGEYEFIHCTIANYYRFGTRQEPALVLNNYYVYNKIIYSFDFSSFFGNCIVYGNSNDEIGMDEKGGGAFTRVFKNCLLKSDYYPSHIFESTVVNMNPEFRDVNKGNFVIDSLSPAIDIGNVEIAKRIPFDLNNWSRLDDKGPDLGAYEWVSAGKSGNRQKNVRGY